MDLELQKHKEDRDKLFSTAPANSASAWLLEQRNKRPKGINDALMFPGSKHHTQNNCSLVAVGSLTGATASQIAAAIGVKGGEQFASVWSDPTCSKDPAIEYDAAHNFVGQIDKMAKFMENFANSSGGDVTLDLSGIRMIDAPDPSLPGGKIPDPLGEREMLEEMAKLPDGTQFATFVFPNKSDGTVNVDDGHWVTAEKYNGQIVFEDYQQALKQRVMVRGRETDQEHSDDERPTVNALPRGPVDGQPIYKSGMFFAIKPTDKVLNAPMPSIPASSTPSTAQPQPQVQAQSQTNQAPTRRAAPKKEKTQAGQVVEFLETVKPMTWDKSQIKDAELFDDLLTQHGLKATTDFAYQPLDKITYMLGDPLAVGSEYNKRQFFDEKTQKRSFAGFSREDLAKKEVKEKFDELEALDTEIDEVKSKSTKRDKTEFWTAAEALWNKTNDTSTNPFDKSKFATLRDFVDQLPKLREAKIGKEFLTRLGDTQTAISTCPVALCTVPDKDPERAILLNENDFKTPGGDPDYDKANAIMLHEAHHASSKGFVNVPFFDDDQSLSWDFDEIVTEYYTKKVWDSKHSKTPNDYFQYTNYFPDRKPNPAGDRWYGHLGGEVARACGGEGNLAKAYFGGDRTALVGREAAIREVVRKAR